MIDLSICIPTYNRLHCLNKCLESIVNSFKNSNLNLEVIITDNNPLGTAGKLIKKYNHLININYIINKENYGIGKNIMIASSLAKGKYSWIIGNDDLLLPNTLHVLETIFKKNSEIDYFFINSYIVNSSKLFSSNSDFDINNKITFDQNRSSNFKHTKKLTFFELINPRISFDFLLGMFLSIYRTELWQKNSSVIDSKRINDLNLYSNFDNTCPHVKIFATTFKNRLCMFHSTPLSINLFGEREWNDLYPFIESIRIPQVIELYKDNGMGFIRYFICKNYALRKLFINLLKIIFMKKYTGLQYISIKEDILKNLIFPLIYIAPFFYLFRKIFKIIKN